MKKVLKEEHRGFGGLYFTFTAIISAIIMSYSIQLSWTSNVVSMADNFAYISTYNAAAYMYKNQAPAMSYTTSISPTLDSFNKMLSDAGIGSGSNTVVISWTGYGSPTEQLRLDFSSFKTKIGPDVKPHSQSVIITK